MADHEETQRLAEEALRKRGYRVKDVELKKDRVIETPEGNPDLIATRGGERLNVEVKGKTKDDSWFVNQLERYSRLEGKTVLLLGIDTSNIELWGIQDLEGD